MTRTRSPRASRRWRARPASTSRASPRADAPPELAFFAEWIARGYAGEMAYLTAQVDRRARPARGVPLGALGASASACSTTRPHPYSTEAPRGRGWIARYAWGDDYHDVMKAHARAPARRGCAAEAGPFESRAYVDTGPIVERAYAAAAGPRRLGQEHLPAAPRARLVVLPRRGWSPTSTLAPDAPRADMCGSCTACLDACPTRRVPRALRARRHALHQLPDDRAEGRDPGGAARRPRPPRVRLRHLPGRVPLEPQAAAPAAAAAFAPRAGRGRARPRRARRRSTRTRFRARFRKSPRQARQAARPAAQRRGRARQHRRRGRAAGARAARRTTRTRSCASTRAGRCAGCPPNAGASRTACRTRTRARGRSRPPCHEVAVAAVVRDRDRAGGPGDAGHRPRAEHVQRPRPDREGLGREQHAVRAPEERGRPRPSASPGSGSRATSPGRRRC